MLAGVRPKTYPRRSMSNPVTRKPDGRSDPWPSLPFEAWSDTCATLHRWTQIVGKIRLAQCAPINHSWHVTLYVTASGLTTGLVPHGERTFQIDFDFIEHRLVIRTDEGRTGNVALSPQSVASFYGALMREMTRLDLRVEINTRPNEVPDPIPFDRDTAARAYDSQYANRFWRVLLQTDRVFETFRSRFIGKCSPVHFFWGAPDLAVTRFSGRRAPEHPGGIPNLPDRVTREAYSHEVSSCGFWPGSAGFPRAAFYSYAYPEPAGFAAVRPAPAAAFYSSEMREFFLPYDAVRESAAPDETLLEFLQTTYEAAANLGGWDRAALER
jgi:uncharacterized protein DUF5996